MGREVDILKYNDDKYDHIRDEISELIKISLEENEDYSNVYFARGKDEDFLNMYLNIQSNTKNWKITSEEWKDLVYIEIKSRGKYELQDKRHGFILREGEYNKLEVPKDRKSIWQRFKNKILKDELKFDHDTIVNIEKDTENILQSLKLNTDKSNPNKGLVIGSVQSGKTTSMAALMAMAAHYDFNVFIILSGTIENLRIQTEQRLQDLLSPTNSLKSWELIKRPNNLYDSVSRTLTNSNLLYSVVLKNSTRLRDLINWLTYDENQMGKMNILIIDDEADQASVNTSIDVNERKRINDLIVNLVHGKSAQGKNTRKSYSSLNYIGYTATPYANILSESPGGESLYPKDFISILTTNPKHFGPKKIFGMDGEEEYGLDIIRAIDNPKNVRLSITGDINEIDIQVKESVAYFIAASASLRLHKFKSPVSMLVHISNKIDDHNKVFEKITRWLKKDKKEVIYLAEKIWERETKLFNIKNLDDSNIYYDFVKTRRPHKFNEIRDEINSILGIVSPIYVDGENQNLEYHNGIHTILDHSKTKVDDNKELRLLYPNRKADIEKTPIFIVIGGATLSRGLTLEGLITSFFLREPSAADTLTQMGRWFGYRINYELYPRIWLTKKTKTQFEYISTVEEELREEIRSMNARGLNFSKIGPKILNNPHVINITAKNKQRAAQNAMYDFTGYRTQTYIFDKNTETQKFNYTLARNFISNLGEPNIYKTPNKDNIVWTNVNFRTIIKDFLIKFKFNQRIKSLNQIDELIEWVNKTTDKNLLNDWNIVLIGKGKINNESINPVLDYFENNKVTRSKLKNDLYLDSEINIKALRSPADVYTDIDQSKIKDKKIVELLKNNNKTNIENEYEVRELLNLHKTPQLMIYVIDKKSKPTNSNTNREELDFDTDIIGLYINIPSGDKNKNYVSHITVKTPNNYMEEYDYNEPTIK